MVTVVGAGITIILVTAVVVVVVVVVVAAAAASVEIVKLIILAISSFLPASLMFLLRHSYQRRSLVPFK